MYEIIRRALRRITGTSCGTLTLRARADSPQTLVMGTRSDGMALIARKRETVGTPVASIHITGVRCEESSIGIDYSSVAFAVEGNATREQIVCAITREADDMANFVYDEHLKRGTYVTIDFSPNEGDSLQVLD